MRQNETTAAATNNNGNQAQAHRQEGNLQARLRRSSSLEEQQAMLAPSPIFLSRSGAGGAHGADAFEHATGGSKGSVPHLGMMEQAFGRSFAGVDAYVGGDRANSGLAAMGARGAARGNTVAFASASPSPKLVAHELAHVVQGNGAVHASSVVAPDGCAAEVEADAVSERVAAGLPAGPIGAQGGGAGIYLDRVPSETNLDGTERKEIDGTNAPVGGSSVVPGVEKTSSAGEGTEVVVETTTQSETGDEVSVVTDTLDANVLGTAKNLAGDLDSDATLIDEHDIPQLEEACREYEASENKEALAAAKAKLVKLRARSKRLSAEATNLRARVEAEDPTLTMADVKASAAKLEAGDDTAVVYKSTGKSVEKSVDSSKFSDKGYAKKSGSLEQEVDAEGNVVRGSGQIDTNTVGFEDGKAVVGNSVERGDGTSQDMKLKAGADGGALEMSETDAKGNKHGGSLSLDTKNKAAAGELKSSNKGGEHSSVGFNAKQGKDGAEDEYSANLGAGQTAVRPGDKAYSGDLKVGNQELALDTKYKLPRKGGETKGYQFNVGGGGSVKVTTKVTSDNPLKYAMTVVVSGTFTLGGSADAKKEGVGGVGVTAAYTKALSKSYTRHYDATRATGALAEFETLQTAKPTLVEKWAMGLGLVGKGGGDLVEVGDENVTEESDKVVLGAEGNVSGAGLGLSAKAGYEGEFKTKVTEKVVKDGVVRVTVLYGKAEKVSAGGGVEVVTNAAYDYSVNWSSAESLSIDLKQDHQAYAERIAALKNAKDLTELRQYAKDFGGASGWSKAEGKHVEQGAKGGYTITDEGLNLSVGAGASDSSEVNNEVSLDADTKVISSKGTGKAQAKAGLSVGGGDVWASDHTDGGSANSVGDKATLSLDSEHKETGLRSGLPDVADISGAPDVVGLVRTLFTDTETTLSGTNYGSKDVSTLLAASGSKQRWDSAASLAGLGGSSYKAWGALRGGLRNPRGRNRDYYAQIKDATNLSDAEKTRLAGELNLANQMAALNEFLAAAGADGQKAIRMVLERRHQSTSVGGARRQVGDQYYWPSSLTELKGRWTKTQASVGALQRGYAGLVDSEDTTAANLRIKTVRGEVDKTLREFEQAREHYLEHPEAHADMMAKMKGQRSVVVQLRRRFLKDHAAKWHANDHSSADDEQTFESRDPEADETERLHAEQDAEELELKRQYAEEMQTKLGRQNDRCRGFKARERALFAEIREAGHGQAVRLASTDLPQHYDKWIGVIQEYRRLLDEAQWPESSRNISARGGRRTARLEPDHPGLVRLWKEIFGHADNNLLYRVKTY